MKTFKQYIKYKSPIKLKKKIHSSLDTDQDSYKLKKDVILSVNTSQNGKL